MQKLCPGIENAPFILEKSNYVVLDPFINRSKIAEVSHKRASEIYQLHVQMLEEVWSSEIVQFLLKRNELDLFPWKECAVLRCYDYDRYKDLFFIHEEWAGGKPSRHRWQLPRIILKKESKNRVKSKPRPFNLHDWREWITVFEEGELLCVSTSPLPARTWS